MPTHGREGGGNRFDIYLEQCIQVSGGIRCLQLFCYSFGFISLPGYSIFRNDWLERTGDCC